MSMSAYKKLRIGVAVAFLVLITAFSFAETEKEKFLKVSLTGYLVVSVVDDKGFSRETFLPLPESILPGAIIQYEINASNSSLSNEASNVLKNVGLFGAIPKGTAYLEKTASEEALAAFSIDGGKTYSPWPVVYKGKRADGSETTMTAEPGMCTGIRWTIPNLKPQEKVKVTYRVQVLG